MIAIVLMLILFLVLLPVLFMGGWQLYIHKISTKKPLGTDKTMLEWGEHIPVINGFEFKCDTQWPFFYQNFKLRLQKLLEQNKSPLKIFFNKITQHYEYHTSLAPDTILFEYPEKKQCTKLWLPKDTSIIINACPNKGWIYIIWDHASFDGTRLYNEVLSPLFQLKTYKAPGFFTRYTPLLTEARIGKLLWKSKHDHKHQPLKTFSDYESQYCCFIRMDSIILKKLKTKYQSTLSEVILAMYCFQIFKLLKKEKQSLKLGLLIACDHPRFRNNYSMVCLTVNRDPLFENIIKQVMGQRPDPGAIQGMYQLLTFAKTQTFLKQNVLDCLISPFFFQSKVEFSKQIKDFEFMNIPTSSPIYSLYISYKNQLNISATINTPDIDRTKLKALGAEIVPFHTLS
jgi:hypothetical protein